MTDRARTKLVQRARRTTDVTRARAMALGALGAAIGAGVALVAARTPSGTERPLARSHAKAKLACAACHEVPASTVTAAASVAAPPAPSSFAASGACKECHGKTEHASVRSAHRELAAKGALTCATCHPAHEGAQGVSFGEAGAFVRWGVGGGGEGTSLLRGARVKPGVTVPLVSLAACATCHDPTSARDPIAACVPADARGRGAGASGVSLCFDEHRTVAVAEGRLVAWEGAREVAATTNWVSSARPSGSPFVPLGGALGGALALGAAAALLERRKRRAEQPPAPKAAVPAARKRLPVINPGTCLGCYACVDVCPFDVLTIERYVAVVARPEECCGVVLCEQVCPNGSLTIAVGEPVLDRPGVTEHLESTDVPGLFIAGDLTGLPLIKNAINQGVRAVDRIAATRPRRRTTAIDVVVVGAGPAGLSAALRAKEKGLSCVVLEQSTVAASVKSFPRDKIVYDPPLALPVEGELWMKEATKEELVAQWTRIVRARGLDVREGQRVTAIERDTSAPDGAFLVTTGEGGESYRASRLVVAIGRRGTPRLLDLAVDPGAEERVSYALADARSFAGKRVVIAGLGDNAMEAAIALARQPQTTVTIAHRGATFTRGKSRNIAEVKGLAAEGRLRVLFQTVPVAVTRTTITIAGVTAVKGRRTLQADALLVLVGGLPSWDLLLRAGIRHPGSPKNQ